MRNDRDEIVTVMPLKSPQLHQGGAFLTQVLAAFPTARPCRVVSGPESFFWKVLISRFNCLAFQHFSEIFV
jgi:hypothetical protein